MTKRRFDAYADWLLRFTQPGGDEEIQKRARTFRVGFLFLLVAQMAHFVFHDRYYLLDENGPLWGARDAGAMLGPLMAFAVFASAALSLMPRLRERGLLVLSALSGFHIFWAFPHVANHSFLMLFCLLGLTLFATDSVEDQALLLAGLRWLAVIVLFWSGVQKLLHGQFFEGEFLAQRIAIDPRYASFFSLVMPEEVARLRGLPPTGPFVLQSGIGLVISNLTYLTEIALGLILLLGRSLRPLAWAAAALLIVGIQLGAREFYFGVAMLQILVLFAPGPQHERAAPIFAAAPVLLLLASFGLIPGTGIT